LKTKRAETQIPKIMKLRLKISA